MKYKAAQRLFGVRAVGPLLPHGDADDFFSDNVNKRSFLIRPNEGAI